MKKNLFIIIFTLAIVLPNIVYYVFRDHFDTENYENRAYARLHLKILRKFPKVSKIIIWTGFRSKMK